jgi:hypothetical protein
VPTNPGINPIFNMAMFDGLEKQIINRLAAHFYITRASEVIQVQNSMYRSFLMRPTDEMTALLNVDREILVVFAPYEAFEARTLKVYDKVYEMFEPNRIDPSLRLLISKDNDIEAKIRHYLLQEPEYPVLIPFKYRDFLAPSDEFMFASIRKNYLIRDLFGFQSPLRHEYFFFGRKSLIDSVVDRHKSGQNSGLFGLRKSGKTSTIYAIQRRAKAALCKTILLDCQDPAVHARRYGPLLEWIVSETRREVGLKKLQINLGSRPDEISVNFRNAMNGALNASAANILILFDEIENISPETAASSHWRTGEDTVLFWQIIRSFYQSLEKPRTTFCFVGTNPRLFELPRINGIDNPVYLFAPKTFIPMLTLSETTDMLKRLGYFMGLDFTDASLSHIYRRFGGHPFFIRQLASQVHRQIATTRPRDVSLLSCREAELSSSSDFKRYMGEILDSLGSFYPDEFEMIEYLAEDNLAEFAELADYDTAYVEHLIGYGLVSRRGADYEFAFEAAKDAVKQATHKQSAIELGDKWAEISKRRNQLEEEIRTALYHWAIRLTAQEWTETWSQSLSQKRLTELGALTRQEAFSRNNSPLYLLDLMGIIRYSKQYSNHDSSNMSILAAIDIVNRNRIDAHAKKISDNDYLKLSQALIFLENIFLPPE